ncbi:MAG: 30S ribosomal protein S4e [Candidatus Woesearchaeota archaeon]
MTTGYLKRLAAPKEWPIARKTAKFILRPRGELRYGLPLGIVLRDVLGYAKTMREAKYILNTREVLVDGTRRKDEKIAVALMSTLDFPDLEAAFRMVIGEDKKLKLVKISKEESIVKVCRINNKKTLNKGKMQLNLNDGTNVLSDNKDCKTGDSAVLALPKREVKSFFKLEKGAIAYLFGGEHAGTTGNVEGIDKDKLVIKSGKDTFETLKKFAIVIGNEKPAVTVTENGK